MGLECFGLIWIKLYCIGFECIRLEWIGLKPIGSYHLGLD